MEKTEDQEIELYCEDCMQRLCTTPLPYEYKRTSFYVGIL